MAFQFAWMYLHLKIASVSKDHFRCSLWVRILGIGFQKSFTPFFILRAFLRVKQNLIVAKKFKAHPSPKMEKYINWDCNWKQQTVETDTGCTCAALGEVFIHTG